jgi:hypothetical protein
MNSDHLSVEANSDGFFVPSNQFESTFDTDLSSLFDYDPFGLDIDVAGVCESSDLVGRIR